MIHIIVWGGFMSVVTREPLDDDLMFPGETWLKNDPVIIAVDINAMAVSNEAHFCWFCNSWDDYTLL
mgnify:CR=1 FL=1